MQKNKMPRDVQAQLKIYIEYLIEEENSKKHDQQEFLDTLPETLQKQVLISLNGKLLTQNALFSNNFRLPFLTDLSTKLKERTLSPGESVYNVSALGLLLL